MAYKGVDLMDCKKIFVAGAGLMGSGVAQVAAQAGYLVTMQDVSQQSLDRGMANIKQSVGRFVKKGVYSAEQELEILGRIKTTLTLEIASDADLVIEAIFENLDAKQAIFKQLDEICPAHTILATNTSALSITKIASITGRADRVIGMHFFSPVPMMKLVEIIPGIASSDSTVEVSQEVGRRMGKESVLVRRDFGGFLANRIGLPYSRMAIIALTEGLGSAEDIDQAMRLGFGMPMGPLELADLTGLDILLNAMTNIYVDLGDDSYSPPPLLKRMVDAGYLGRKTKRGFYQYDENGKRI